MVRYPFGLWGVVVRAYEILKPVMRAWYAKAMADSHVVLKPVDASLVTADSEDGDAVLLVGNGPAHGWGVVTH